MVYGGGLQREHDRIDREAADERAYHDFEDRYIYENMQPSDVGDWEWRLMFDRLISHETRRPAMQDAKEMAIEIGASTLVNELYPGCYQAIPHDYYEKSPFSGPMNRYQDKKLHFIKSLVAHGKYPDLPTLAKEKGYYENHRISRHHFHEISAKHTRWKKEYESLEDCRQIELDDDPF